MSRTTAAAHMRRVLRPVTLALALSVASSSLLIAQSRVVIRAGRLIDGKGGIRENVVLVVEGSRITRIASGDDMSTGPITYDLARYTLMPGMIDTHVHIDTHFGPDGRLPSSLESQLDRVVAAGQNAEITLRAGFTTVQSIGAPPDVELRYGDRPRRVSRAARADVGLAAHRRADDAGPDSRMGPHDGLAGRGRHQDLRVEEHS